MSTWILNKHTGTPFHGPCIEQIRLFKGDFGEVKAQARPFFQFTGTDDKWIMENERSYYFIDSANKHIGYTLEKI